jgi:transcriptional regulator with XRE-family HTH domain
MTATDEPNGHRSAEAADRAAARWRGERIRIAIQQRGVRKLAALAAEIGVTEGALTRWRQGGPMSLENGIRFCQVLDISLDWLAMGRAHSDHHKEQQLDQDRLRLLMALDALPPGSDVQLAKLLEHIATGRGSR